MDFRVDESQIALQETVGRFCAARFALDRIGERDGAAVDRDVWKEMAALGIFGLLLPETAGASGLGAAEATVVFEQLGSYLVPGPVLWTVVGASLIEGATAGDQLIGGLDRSDCFDDPLLVEHAREVDVLLVVEPDGVACHRAGDLPPALELSPLDPLTPVGSFTELPAGEMIGDAVVANRIRVLGTLLTAAMLLGVSARALEVARSYALEREQFGVPIGSFQAVKHILADMYVRTSVAQSAAYAAAAVVDAPGGDDPTRAVAAAKLLAAEAAVGNATAAVQVLGGMGFTWEMLPNYLLKRAWVLEQSFGTADAHALNLGSTIEQDAR